MLDSLIAKFGVASPSTDLPTFGFPAYPPWVQERAAFARSATGLGARKGLRGLDGLHHGLHADGLHARHGRPKEQRRPGRRRSLCLF